jgi:hypothetical protein
LADKVLSHHTFVQALPYASLILIAIGLQYFQMRQLNNRNPQFAQSNPQAQMMQRYMPLIFAVIYINIAAGVNIYFIISSLCRIGIQEAIFRSGALNKAAPAAEGVLPSAGGGGSGTKPRRRPLLERLADMQAQALEQKEAQRRAQEALPAAEGDPAPKKAPPSGSGPTRGPSSNGGPKSDGKPPPKPGGTGTPKANGQGSSKNQSSSKNTNGAASNGSGDQKPTHPRSKTKRERKDR